MTGDKQLGMGVVLALIDCLRDMEPPPGTTARQAMLDFAEQAEGVAIEDFGLDDWMAFVAMVRQEEARQAGVQ